MNAHTEQGLTRPITETDRNDRRWLWTGALTALAVSVAYTEIWAVASGREENPVRASLVVAAISVVTTLILFRFLPRFGTRATLTLAVASLLTSIVVWAGAPIVMAVAVLVNARHLAAQQAWGEPRLRLAVVIAAVALVAQLVLVVLN